VLDPCSPPGQQQSECSADPVRRLIPAKQVPDVGPGHSSPSGDDQGPVDLVRNRVSQEIAEYVRRRGLTVSPDGERGFEVRLVDLAPEIEQRIDFCEAGDMSLTER